MGNHPNISKHGTSQGDPGRPPGGFHVAPKKQVHCPISVFSEHRCGSGPVKQKRTFLRGPGRNGAGDPRLAQLALKKSTGSPSSVPLDFFLGGRVPLLKWTKQKTNGTNLFKPLFWRTLPQHKCPLARRAMLFCSLPHALAPRYLLLACCLRQSLLNRWACVLLKG